MVRGERIQEGHSSAIRVAVYRRQRLLLSCDHQNLVYVLASTRAEWTNLAQ